ncbi:hypothetical protein JQ617_07720 [Bradyrhizobium sp. KB893862 SZCCT0404]|uniref:hypothetical protein n=1 Tax=Bradyrhizobium sp. KB893862 SZCCT0404 TaxID=2807672 RepID=UPI001BAADBA1|nr:hypothetical protein [Bradyrhizobium sp. KB893862 SZCCT0404]MBR1173837.1 hypothetical protein [Bradyrhizobium sp. KB893862 SZCCT0404]
MALNTKTVLVAPAIVIALLVVARILRYEPYGADQHRNRYTGAICNVSEECWFK